MFFLYCGHKSLIRCLWLAFFEKKFLILIKSNLPIFLPRIMLFALCLQSHHQTQDHIDSSCMFSSRNFLVLHFVFSSFNHFELIFVAFFRYISRFTFLYINAQLFLHHLLKRLSFLLWTAFVSLSKINWLNLHGLINYFFKKSSASWKSKNRERFNFKPRTIW